MPDMTGWKLNPLFSLCYLMGFPEVWAVCGIRAMMTGRKQTGRKLKHGTVRDGVPMPTGERETKP
jgi:hypothetical protein